MYCISDFLFLVLIAQVVDCNRWFVLLRECIFPSKVVVRLWARTLFLGGGRECRFPRDCLKGFQINLTFGKALFLGKGSVIFGILQQWSTFSHYKSSFPIYLSADSESQCNIMRTNNIRAKADPIIPCTICGWANGGLGLSRWWSINCCLNCSFSGEWYGGWALVSGPFGVYLASSS